MREKEYTPQEEFLCKQLMDIEEMAHAVMNLGSLFGELWAMKSEAWPEASLLDELEVTRGLQMAFRYIGELQEWKLQGIRDALGTEVPAARREVA